MEKQVETSNKTLCIYGNSPQSSEAAGTEAIAPRPSRQSKVFHIRRETLPAELEERFN